MGSFVVESTLGNLKFLLVLRLIFICIIFLLALDHVIRSNFSFFFNFLEKYNAEEEGIY